MKFYKKVKNYIKKQLIIYKNIFDLINYFQTIYKQSYI